MPWIAIYEGEKRGPFQVPRKTDVECPTCKGRMRVWRESSDGKARHFKHIDGMGSGGGSSSAACETVAESDKHIKWKNLAAQRLLDEFSDNVGKCRVEMGLKAPISDKDRRVGDAVLLFEERDEQLGRGIVVEVQHKNHTKDIEATTADYVGQDLSIVWTYEDDYAIDRCKLTEIDLRKRAQDAVWPDYAPEESTWLEPQYNFKAHEPKWANAYDTGLTETTVPARLPPDYYDTKAREIWELQYWYHLFPASQRGFTYKYKAEKYIFEVRETLTDGPESTVRLPPEQCDELAMELWRSEEWDELFPQVTSERLDGLSLEYQSEVYLEELRDQLSSPVLEVRIPIEIGWIYSAWKNGLDQLSETKEQLPEPSEWNGTLDLDIERVDPEIRVRFPRQIDPSTKEVLRNIWCIFADNSFDNIVTLSDSNADRSCGECGCEARHYVQGESINGFYCTTCLAIK
ncbi:hypothetical protein SAMN05192552_10661 [Natrinema hispanicum]|uniref:Competence protein CoiA-like family protein n=2 Tax=Natrinema hispanicum TaxID=392421 RepID=A0A1G6YFS2_9EURY|nr:hypothetical protein SAMN05192552_10661 [Natrinema hispanicum]